METPEVVGLCPNPMHYAEFYVPHGGQCPEPGCTAKLIEYRRVDGSTSLPTERTEKMNDVERIARIVYDTAIAPRAPFAATEASKYENVKDELEATVAALLTKGTGD